MKKTLFLKHFLKTADVVLDQFSSMIPSLSLNFVNETSPQTLSINDRPICTRMIREAVNVSALKFEQLPFRTKVYFRVEKNSAIEGLILSFSPQRHSAKFLQMFSPVFALTSAAAAAAAAAIWKGFFLG